MHSKQDETARDTRLRIFLSRRWQELSLHERYRLGILTTAMFGNLVSAIFFAVEAQSLPVNTLGRACLALIVFLSLGMLASIYKKTVSNLSVLLFGLVAAALLAIHMLTLKTVYVGFFHWVPWAIVFVSLLAGRHQGFLIAVFALLLSLLVVHYNAGYGHSLGVYGDFKTLFFHYAQSQTLSMLAMIVMMFSFAFYNNRMEAELQKQHVIRAQTAHQATLGAMLGNMAHEVNNPLAIVHSALILYRQLLRRQKLNKEGQVDLIQKISDALERLRQVVQDLDGPRQQPLAQAIPEDQNKGPAVQAKADSPLLRRRSLFYKLMRWTIRGLDLTLPSITKEWPITQRFRARTTALICSAGLIAMSVNYLQLIMERSSPSLQLLGSLFLGIGVVSMVALKLIPKPQVIGMGYVILLYGVTVVIACTSGRSVLNPALHWFPHMVAYLFLVARPRRALAGSLAIVIGHVLLMRYLEAYGFQLAFGQTFPEYIVRLRSTLVLANVTMFVLAAGFTYLLNATHEQLMIEKDWHLISARHRELHELAASAALLIGKPVRALLDELQALAGDGDNTERLRTMQQTVDHINRVSQSFSLLSRPKLNEDIQTIEGKIWLEHIQNISLRRAAEAGWELRTTIVPEDGMIQGPLGSLTMLAITALTEAFSHPASTEGAVLRLQVQISAETTRLFIQYPAFPQTLERLSPHLEWEEAMRTSLFRELLDSLAASCERRQNHNEVLVDIQWRHADFAEQS